MAGWTSWLLNCPPGHKREQRVKLDSVFRWDCQGEGTCCGHETPCAHGDVTGNHRIGPILWERRGGRWGCPFLRGGKLCGIHPDRPLTCRLFPLGIVIDPNAKVVYLYRAEEAAQQCPPCADTTRAWTVEEYLENQGAWDRIHDACLAYEKGDKVLL